MGMLKKFFDPTGQMQKLDLVTKGSAAKRVVQSNMREMEAEQRRQNNHRIH